MQLNRSKAKVFAIGLDSADKDIIFDMLNSGQLPIINSLVQRGAWGELNSPIGMGDEAVWASFCTSLSPSKHGRYFYRQIQSSSYDTKFSSVDDMGGEPFWKTLSSSGYKVGIVDVPKCPLTNNINGLQIADWLVHGRSYEETVSEPPNLASYIIGLYGDDKTDVWGSDEFLCEEKSLPTDKYEIFTDRSLKSIEAKVTLASELLQKEPWDLFLVVFKESHCVGHQCWHISDARHPCYDPKLSQLHGNPIKKVYQSLDSAIGRLLATCLPENIIIFSDLGMGPNYTGEHILDDILIRLEKEYSIRQKIKLNAIFLQNKLTGKQSRITDPNVRRFRYAFQLPHNEISGAVRINLRGREPNGQIRNLRDLEKFYSFLINNFISLKNPVTGNKIVDKVIKTDLLYQGENRDQLPDLFIIWNRDEPITSVSSPVIGLIKGNDFNYRTGNHLHGGFYIASGPKFSVGKNEDTTSIMDLGPTIAKILNVDIQNIDGKLMPALRLN